MIEASTRPPSREWRTAALTIAGGGVASLISLGYGVGWPFWLFPFSAAMVLALGICCCPRLFEPLAVGLKRVEQGITYGVVVVLLTAAYFLLVTPYGWILRRLGHDPLRSSGKPEWNRRVPPRSPEEYFRQF